MPHRAGEVDPVSPHCAQLSSVGHQHFQTVYGRSLVIRTDNSVFARGQNHRPATQSKRRYPHRPVAVSLTQVPGR
jgi:hypothetical protein